MILRRVAPVKQGGQENNQHDKIEKTMATGKQEQNNIASSLNLKEQSASNLLTKGGDEHMKT